MFSARPPRTIVRSSLVLLSLAAAACGGSSSNTPAPTSTPVTTPVVPSVTTVRFGTPPLDDVVVVGTAATLSAQALSAAGTAVAGQTIAWSSSDPQTLDVAATSGASTSATVTPKKGGLATVSAAVGSVTASMLLSVHEPASLPAAGAANSQLSLLGGVVALTIPGGASVTASKLHVGPAIKASPASASVVGSVYEFSPDGLKLDKPLVLTLQHPAASIPAGNVLLLSARGAASWTALAGGTWDATARSVSANITQLGAFAAVLQPQVATSIAATPAAATVNVGGSTQLTATVRDQIGSIMTAPVTWTSAAPSVATVSTAGVVQGVAVGTTNITASAATGVTVNIGITVSAAPGVTSVSVSPSTVTLAVGATQQLSATVVASAGLATTVTWSAVDSTKATVSASGLVTAVAAPGAQVCARATADATKQGCATITVTAPIVVAISPSTASLTIGQLLQFSATVTGGASGTASTVTWFAADATKVSVSASGLANALAVPGTQVCARSTVDTAKQSCATVTVSAPAFPSSADVATVGNTFSPNSVEIGVGGRVNFTFDAVHNVIFDSKTGVPADIPNTASGTVSRTFGTVGSFAYQCTLHGGMTGTVVVR